MTDSEIVEAGRREIARLKSAGEETPTWRGLAHTVCPEDYTRAYWLLLQAGVFAELNALTGRQEGRG